MTELQSERAWPMLHLIPAWVFVSLGFFGLFWVLIAVLGEFKSSSCPQPFSPLVRRQPVRSVFFVGDPLFARGYRRWEAGAGFLGGRVAENESKPKRLDRTCDLDVGRTRTLR